MQSTGVIPVGLYKKEFISIGREPSLWKAAFFAAENEEESDCF